MCILTMILNHQLVLSLKAEARISIGNKQSNRLSIDVINTASEALSKLTMVAAHFILKITFNNTLSFIHILQLYC